MQGVQLIIVESNVFVLQVVKRKYQQEYDIAPPITFAGDNVSLDIPDDGTQTDNGWEIVPLQKARVSSIGLSHWKICMLDLTACWILLHAGS